MMSIRNHIKNAILGTVFESSARKVLMKVRSLAWPDRKEKINNTSFIIPHIRGTTSGYSERWMLPLLSKVLKLRSETFLDVGVNTGQTLLKVKSIEPERSYIGFEPNPSCVFYVEELIKINKISNVLLVPVGIYVENTILYLNRFTDLATDSSASVISDFRPDAEIASQVPVPVFDFGKLDYLFTKSKFGVVKIDVEGAELEVLKSLKPMIERDRPIIFLEILPAYDIDNKVRISRQSKIEELFQDLNYEILQVGISSDGSFVKLIRLDELEVHSDLNKCEYIFAPPNDVDNLCA